MCRCIGAAGARFSCTFPHGVWSDCSTHYPGRWREPEQEVTLPSSMVQPRHGSPLERFSYPSPVRRLKSLLQHCPQDTPFRRSERKTVLLQLEANTQKADSPKKRCFAELSWDRQEPWPPYTTEDKQNQIKELCLSYCIVRTHCDCLLATCNETSLSVPGVGSQTQKCCDIFVVLGAWRRLSHASRISLLLFPSCSAALQNAVSYQRGLATQRLGIIQHGGLHVVSSQGKDVRPQLVRPQITLPRLRRLHKNIRSPRDLRL